ncbi:MAG: DNA topoisomerase III, partial [Betaproteobacteria bacterium]|nr:DNA topoisomerase III [Betaproteobacteria bacterium]
MSKTLIIAEKPSVANDIAKALGGFNREGEYFESEHYLLSSAVGHLVEIAAPEAFEVKRGKWSFAHLPVLPDHFDVRPIPKNEDRLKMLTRLIKRKDVSALINACDAGREGELIFQLIVQHAKGKQPIKRLWLQSMTPAAIREAFGHLREQKQMQALADAARCRSEADWLVGINGTRAMTAFNSRDGGFFLTTVGRVQTPTLAIVVEREEQIKRFIPKAYFELSASFLVLEGAYTARWFDPAFKKPSGDPEARAERLWDASQAGAIERQLERLLQSGAKALARDEAKPSSQSAAALFDLTSLQREANSRYGFSAKTTLSLAQALYEKHKLLTYPRTDSKHLPEDYLQTVQDTLAALSKTEGLGNFAQSILQHGWVKPNKRVFDNSKVSDHFAIIPTPLAPKPAGLSDAEAKIYDMVARRFLAVFFPPAQFLVTTRITHIGDLFFKTEGKVLIEPGWLAVMGRDRSDPEAALPKLSPRSAVEETAAMQDFELHALHTRPPARFSEASLLSAMESAGKRVDEEDWREAMAEKGLGTPATRAAIIEGLLAENYLYREGRELVPTTKAFQLMTLLRGLGVEELTLPELTGGWEHKLSLMERGELERAQFMREISLMAKQIVERAKNFAADTVPGDFVDLQTPCPACANLVKENYRRYACVACDFSISKTPGARSLSVEEAEQLIRQREIGPLQGFRSKQGRPFTALLRLGADHRLAFDFGQGTSGAEENAEAADFSQLPVVGDCPKCKGRVLEQALAYACEHSLSQPKSCDFRSGKVILQQMVSSDQMQKLLREGKTDLLNDFVSSK